MKRSYLSHRPLQTPNQHIPRPRTVRIDCVEVMSRSTKQSTYNPIPVSTSKPLHVSEKHQSPSFIEERSEHPQPESKHLIRHWQWEICTFLLGTAAFATILALLLRFRNKPPQPINLGNGNLIQLTAIIAALAQVAQSSLLVPISYCIGQLKWSASWFSSHT